MLPSLESYVLPEKSHRKKKDVTNAEHANVGGQNDDVWQPGSQGNRLLSFLSPSLNRIS